MKNNYWHIQLQPDNKIDIHTIKSIITSKKVIGMGDSWSDKNGNPVNDPKVFKDQVKVGDIVMVRDGSSPIALVKVISDAYIEPNINEDFDWFTLRRKIENLGFYGEEEQKLLSQILVRYEKKYIQAPGTLTYCQGRNATNDFIAEWYKTNHHRELMENIKLSSDRQDQIKALWGEFKKKCTSSN